LRHLPCIRPSSALQIGNRKGDMTLSFGPGTSSLGPSSCPYSRTTWRDCPKRVLATLRAWIWRVYGGQNGSKSAVWAARKAMLQARQAFSDSLGRCVLGSPHPASRIEPLVVRGTSHTEADSAGVSSTRYRAANKLAVLWMRGRQPPAHVCVKTGATRTLHLRLCCKSTLFCDAVL
jgi:hypothetical protein